MKKTLLGALIILFTGLHASAFEDSLKVNEKKSFDLALSDVSNATKITLQDKRDNILFEETIQKGESFTKTFNMELLPEGEYSVEIENATKISVMKLLVNKEEVVMQGDGSQEIYKPVISEKGSSVYLTQFSPQSKPLYVAIYNSRSELVYEGTLSGRIDLGKVFDFSKTQSGNYRFYMESDGMSYDQLVYIGK